MNGAPIFVAPFSFVHPKYFESVAISPAFIEDTLREPPA